MHVQRSVAWLVIVSFVLAPAAATHGHVEWEAEESNRPTLDLAGQKNGVPEAYRDRGATPGGLRLLDDFWDNTGGHAAVPGVEYPLSVLGGEPPRGSTFENHGDTRRATGGLAAPLIVPGASRFLAWYGYWDDKNEDGRIDEFATTSALNEWTLTPGAKLYSYVEPGPRPTLTAKTRPAATDPDFTYVDSGPALLRLYKSGSQFLGEVLVFLDGSLLQTLRVDTVTDPVLAPSGPARPYTPRPDSLVDIDIYASLAPGPVEALYAATAAPLVHEFASPSQGLCPTNCRGLPWSPGPVASPLVGPAYALVYERYLQETHPDSRSSAAGRLHEFREAHRGWADLIALYATPNDPYTPDVATPLPGRGANGLPAMIPGYLGFEVRTGLWRDVTDDGFVGRVGSDPYDHGNRPIADRYEDSAGEYLGVYARDETGREIRGSAPVGGREMVVTFRPVPSWGEAGVLVTWDTGTPAVDVLPFLCVFTIPPPSGCPPLGAFLSDPPRSLGHVTGDAVVTVTAVAGAVDPGRYATNGFLFLPTGTQNFAIEVCTEPLVIRHVLNGDEIDEPVRDCDVIDRLET
ncbi:MAG TPA: hypothetical protein VM889_03450 [Candidatus Thermoplasmatota archaeon]|nr:hypothetical protein [Candidatus Thermoplasmatota archaeon]